MALEAIREQRWAGVEDQALDADLLVAMLRGMVMLRVFDETVSKLCKRGAIPGLIHLGIGEEAVAVGTCAAIRPTDHMTSTHRAHGHFLAKGGDPRAFMAELFGRETGCCGGFGGSMHLVDLNIGFLGANGVVGAGLPLAVGGALGAQILGSDAICVCFFGDGANNQGTFHESLNLAAVWNLPVLFICENNDYGISTSIHDQQKVSGVAVRGAAYGIPAEVIDGNDVKEVYAAVSKAAGKARAGGGPILIECKTYRISGHYEGDPQTYRDKEEIRLWRERDPIIRLRKELEAGQVLTSARVERMFEEARAAAADAVAFAERSPYPPPHAATAHVFGKSPA